MSLKGLVFLVVALLVCFDSARTAETVDWWESATIYQIYPRSFQDSNGDGVGDLNGVTTRLKYLRDIGVTAAWLSPIYQSPMVDMGYDVANYTNIDPIFGTLADFDAMVKEAHKLGLKIILDYVPNHTSDQHEWFKKSVRREAGYEDFYIWEDGIIDDVTGERQPPSNWRGMFAGSAWEWNDERQQYYYHLFLNKQPELNFRNPVVRQRLLDVMQFWLDRGVDAFRLDAVQFLLEIRNADGTYPRTSEGAPNYEDYKYQMNNPENNEVLYEWRAFLDKYQKDNGGDTRAMFAETFSSPEVMGKYITNGSVLGVQMPMNLNLTIVPAPLNASFVQYGIDLWMSEMWPKYKIANWAIGNHDSGRVGTLKGYNVVDALNMIYYTLPGTTFTYYGEEIGMIDYEELKCAGIQATCDFRDPERTPMQWDTTFNAGFSTANKTWLPVNPNYKLINVQTERGKARSTLDIYKGLTKLKKTAAFKAFKEEGGFSYGALNTNVFQVVRTNNLNEEYRVLANLGNQLEHVEGLTDKVMEYFILNNYSPHKKGEKVDFRKRVYLRPYEAVLLRWTA